MDLSHFLQPAPKSPCLIGSAPRFVGIGAQRCGTTWWHGLLNSHPSVYDASHLRGQVQPAYLIKERHFFDRFFNRAFSSGDIYEYHRWCACPDGLISGEWTPRYLPAHWVPPLLKRAAPDAKLLVLLRDPVERFVSGMNFGTRPLSADLAHEHYLRGFFNQQLQHWLKTVDRSQFLVLQYEQCVADPRGQLSRTFAFLGLDDHRLPDEAFQRSVNATQTRRFELTDDHGATLIEGYRDDVDGLFRSFPALDRSFWRNFAT